MELRHLNTFKTIVDSGGFKKAADELGYAQSSITAHIKELEKELGYPLFDRLGKRITLTQTGRKFLPYALEIISLYSKSKEVVAESDEPSGELVIGASESIMIYWLPTVIMNFMKIYPKINLILKSLNYDHLSDQLRKGEIDIAMLVESSNWKSDELTIQKIKDEKLSLFMPFNKTTSHTPETMLVTERSCSWRPIIEDYLKIRDKTSMTKIELPSIEAIKKCVLCGLGISFLPYFTIKSEIENNELKEIRTDIQENNVSIYTAFHKDKYISTNLDVFLSEIKLHQ
ncbi:LysR family transcriptional regulator [Gracilibacillus phocaeensis]|uniref:LysR family transcriptional regulator n=1 Tax=Gracilibacillus phocaeensis TaxID=2042304 RepID=UPI00103092A0|nr:LysR family transcriptional regulator [Gracilibacillus phocaeensis]